MFILPCARSWARWDHQRACCLGRFRRAASLSDVPCSPSINLHSSENECWAVVYHQRIYKFSHGKKRFWKTITFTWSCSLLENRNHKTVGGNWCRLKQQSSGKWPHWKQGWESGSFTDWYGRTGGTVCLPNPGSQHWLLHGLGDAAAQHLHSHLYSSMQGAHHVLHLNGLHFRVSSEHDSPFWRPPVR